jgi:hypothetical protein
VFLEIVEGGRMELLLVNPRRNLILRILLLRLLLLFIDLQWRLVLAFVEKLIEIMTGVSPLKVGQGAAEKLLFVGVIKESIGVLFLEEDVKTVIAVLHLK